MRLMVMSKLWGEAQQEAMPGAPSLCLSDVEDVP